ncbi:MAG: Peroxiredoxin OsmC [Labilithrix sp.]|nr:Peroxiredoxin OsmC [Labilithrix sp.]
MSISQAVGTWEGTLKAGRGTMKPENGSEIPFSLATRFEGKKGSNPEELIGAALAGCFSMALSLGLEKAGMTPQSIQTSSKVHLDKDGEGFKISRIALSTEVRATGGDQAKFSTVAEDTKRNCPVSKALKGAEIVLDAKLLA